MTTNVPVPIFGTTGFQAPLESAILTGTQADLNTAFGGNLNPALNTTQGQLASSLAAIINNVNALFLLYTNLVDPALTSGRMQDAIARIYFIERNPSVPTILQINCIGQGAPIPVGSQIQDASGYFYTCTQSGIIPITGNIVLTFANTIPGPISVPSVVTIYGSIPGWDAVTVVSGVEGNNEETATEFEARRSVSVAQNSIGSLASILGAVLGVTGVLDAFVTENASNSVAIVGGVTLNPNSLYVAALGGTSLAVAQAIWAHKPPGCTYNGNTTVTVFDTSPSYVPPYPAYSVSYQTPNPLQIAATVSMVSNNLVPANGLILVQNALISGFAGLDGLPRAKIGTKLLTSRFYAPITALWPGAQIVSVLFASANFFTSSFTASVSGTTMIVSNVNFGVIAANQFIVDNGIGGLFHGTIIISQISGTAGGIGSYLINMSQTVASEIMAGLVPGLNEITVNINQVPVISANNITLTLV